MRMRSGRNTQTSPRASTNSLGDWKAKARWCTRPPPCARTAACRALCTPACTYRDLPHHMCGESPSPHAANSVRGCLHRCVGNFDNAEPLYRRALAIREKALGPIHVDTTSSIYNLAVLFHNQGAPARHCSTFWVAGPALCTPSRACRDSPAACWGMHPPTCRKAWLWLHGRAGKCDKAEPLYQRALAT
jgi:hypothetical protein